MRIRDVEPRRTWVRDVKSLARMRRALDLETTDRTLERTLIDALIPLLLASDETHPTVRMHIRRAVHDLTEPENRLDRPTDPPDVRGEDMPHSPRAEARPKAHEAEEHAEEREQVEATE